VTEADAIPLLPCYVAGDLPDSQVSAIDALVVQSPELALLVQELRDTQQRSGAAVLCLAMPNLDDLPALESVPAHRPHVATPQQPRAVEAQTARPRGLGRTVWLPFAAAAVALITATVVVTSLRPDAPATAPTTISLHLNQIDAHTLPPLDVTDPARVAAAFATAGVPDAVQPLTDLSEIGLTLTTAFVLPGSPPGAAFVYQEGDVRYICQVWSELPLPVRAPVRAVTRGIALRAFEDGQRSVVSWREGDVICVMSAEVSVERLLAVVQERLRVTA